METATMTRVVWTAGINEEVSKNPVFGKFIMISLQRFATGDWGNTGPEDSAQNNRAVKAWKEKDEDNYQRLLAVYNTSLVAEGKIWIIEEWDRSVRTILFPSEY